MALSSPDIARGSWKISGQCRNDSYCILKSLSSRPKDGCIFWERVTQPYHTIDVFGVFADDLDVFENSKDISDFESSASGVFYSEKEIARLPPKVKEFLFQDIRYGDYSLGKEGQEQQVKKFWFRTPGTHCFFCIDLETKKFILRISAR